MKIDYDLVIVGGGLVGASMACALTDTSLSIAVIEPLPISSNDQPSFDERTITLNESSCQVFNALTLWSNIVATREACAIKAIEVSEPGGKTTAHLSCQSLAINALGYVVPTRIIGQILYDKLQAADNITLFCPAEVHHIDRHTGAVEIVMNHAHGKKTVWATLLVLADGGRSPLKEQLGFSTTYKTYEQALLISTVKTDTFHHGVAHEKLTQNGPLALLPRKEKDYVTVLTLPSCEAKIYQEVTETLFLEELRTIYGDRVGNFCQLGARKTYPLILSNVNKLANRRVVVMGNAAHTVHPIAAQGFNLGLKDVAALAELIDAAYIKGEDIGSDKLLTKYNMNRKNETRFVVNFTDFLIRLFANKHFPVSIARCIGLFLLNKSQYAQQTLLKHALGTDDKHSRLRRGLPLKRWHSALINAATQDYDIVIVGNGLIGSTLACALGNTDYRIAVIDKRLSPSPMPPNPGQFELRVNAYNAATEQLLREINVWEELPKDRIFPFCKVQVHSKNGGSINFSAQDVQQPHLGHFIENSVVNNCLIDHTKQFNNIHMISELEIDDIKTENDSIYLHTNHGELFSAKLLLACDGAASHIRTLAGIDIHCKPYYQKCIVCTIKFDGDLEATAWQRFLSTGPIGLLPLASGYCSLAWSCEQHYADQLLSMSDKCFIAALDQAIQGHLGNITQIGIKAAFPLIARHASTYVAPRIALVGDAAHVIHPLAGLGANIGFQDIAVLKKLLFQAQSNGADIGNLHLLQTYERLRRQHNSMIMHAMTVFNRVFSHDISWLQKIANKGLMIADKMTFAKNILLRQAMWMDS
ncbi:MAG: hypothetical protein GY782_10650 [Gammaproteobacteria bacterium]|nr:hypothetical protein [Gammaproteobacteria bacterium]